MNRILTILSLIAAISVPVVCTAQEDQVFDKKKGTPTRGLISAVSQAQVKIESSGITRAFDVKDILKVTFGDEPAELATARDRALAGQFGDAVVELKKVDMTQISNDVIKQDAAYYAAYCMAQIALNEGGDKAAAKQQMLNFITQNTNTFHFFEGAQLLGDLSTALGEYADAAKYYGGLSKAPWPEYRMQAAVLQARSLSAEGKYAEALTGFEQVLASGLATPEVNEQKMHATVGKAVCLAATGKHEEGIQIVEGLIAKNDPSDASLFGRAYNALGACYMKTDKPQDAILAFLHTDLLFFSDPEAHAEALYYLSKLWADVGKSDRAVRARGTLTERYAGSRWAAMN